MANRRVLAIAAVVIVILCSAAVAFVLTKPDSGDATFTIIHTNDTHCFFDGDGGVGLSTAAALREEYSGSRPVFTVDAGDFLQGNSYGTMTVGEGSVRVMNAVGYDFAVPGNHEFDYGLDVLLERAGQLDFPLICANLVYEDTGKSLFDEYLILERGGVRVGFFGLITAETPHSSMPGAMGNSKVTDPVMAAERMVSLLKGENVDSIVAVGHLGVLRQGFTTSDELCKMVPGIDIFIDGHSHTEMEDGKVCDGSIVLDESDTVIASAGCFAHNVGVVTSGPRGIDAKLYRGPALAYAHTDRAIETVVHEVDEKLATVIGGTEIFLDGELANIRSGETNLGDLVTDALRMAAGVDVAFTSAGSLRASMAPGDIKLKDVCDVMPFLNYTYTLNVPGSVILEEMEYSLSLIGSYSGGYLQFSGMTITYDPDEIYGSRVKSLEIGGKSIDMDATYSLATIDFVAKGGSGHRYLEGYELHPFRIMDVIFADYILSIGTVTDSTIEGGRLIAVRTLGTMAACAHSGYRSTFGHLPL